MNIQKDQIDVHAKFWRKGTQNLCEDKAVFDRLKSNFQQKYENEL